MKDGKVSRAMEYLDDELLLGVLNEDTPSHGTQSEKSKRRQSMKLKSMKTWGAIAAMLAIVVASVFLFTQLISAGGSAVVALDVNPSIELQVNRKEKVTNVTALNEDATVVLGTMDLQDVDLEVAVYAILGSMMEHGYLTSDNNSILVSVDTKNDKHARQLQISLSEKIADTLAGQNIQASVITQTYTHDKDAKAQLVEKIIAAGLCDASGVAYTYDRLIELRVHDLKLILDTKGVTASGMTASGTAGKGNYISREEATAKALEAAGLTKDAISRLELEVDFDDDYRAMVYEIEFIHDGKEYEYELLASDGTILKEEIKAAEVGDRDDDDDNITLPDGCISTEEAKQLALAHASVDEADAFELEVETDREWGKYVYEVEFDTMTHEYEYLIDAQTGEILDSKIKAHRD